MKLAKQLINDSLKELSPTRVLDLGCGKGKFSRRFANNNIEVIGVDKNPTIDSKGNFTFIQQDVMDFKFKLEYDLIIGTGIFHLLKKEDALKLIQKMKEYTLVGGHHFLICMSDKESQNNKTHFYPNQEVLTKLYSDWEIIHNEKCLSKGHGKCLHQHKIILLLAKKI